MSEVDISAVSAKPARSHIAYLLLLVALAALFFWRLWAPGAADRMMIGPADGDFMRQFYPYRVFVADAWSSGHVPLLNPHQYSGSPAWADPQQAVLYPMRLLQVPLALGSRVLPLWAVELEAVLHVALAGWFTFLLLRALGARALASTFGGVTFAFGGYLTGYPVEQLAVLDTAVWIPALLWLLVVAWKAARAGEGRRASRWTLAAAVAGAMLFLAGHPQTAMYGVYAAAVLWAAGLWAIWRADPGATGAAGRSQGALRTWFVLGLAGLLLAAGLGAAQWLPSAILSTRVARDLSYQELSAGLLPRDIVQMLAPARLTLPVDAVPAGDDAPSGDRGAASSPRSAGATTEGAAPGAGAWVPLYIGALALGLILWGAVCVGAARPWVAAAVVAWLVSLGGHTPLYRAVVQYLPAFGLFRHQERIAVLFSLALAVAVGLAVDDLLVHRRAERRRAVWLLALLAGLAVLAATALVVRDWGPAPRLASDAAAYADALVLSALALTAGALVVAAMVRESVSPGAGGWLLIAIAALELFSVNRGRVLAPMGDVYRPDAVVEALKPLAREGRVSSEALLPGGPNAASVYGLYDVTGDSPMQLQRHAWLTQAAPEMIAWRLQAVRYAVSDRSFPPDAPVEAIASDEGATLYQVQLPAPPVWVPSEVMAWPEGTTLEQVDALRLDLDPLRQVLVPPAVADTVESGAAEGQAGQGSAQLSGLDPGRAVTEVVLPATSVVVLSTIYDQGWHAVARATSGEETSVALDVFPAYGALAAAVVPSGSWRVEWTYRPREIKLGLALSCAALLLVLGAFVAQWRSGT